MDSSKMSVKEILYKLVSVQSDTFTEMERDMSDCIMELIRSHPYWTANPELCGEYTRNDPLDRKVVWALRKGTGKKTVVLTGHYDTVEIDCYGTLKPYALHPDDLKTELAKLDLTEEVRRDLESGDWGFGRGMADMKGGVACNLFTLFTHVREDINILYTGIPDEEHQAEGIMMSVPLMIELKEQYQLDYELAVLTEPHTRKDTDKYMMYDGSIGKMLPCIMAKSKLCHVGNLMSGLNAALLISNVVRRLELNCDFSCKEFNSKTPPPTMLYLKDSKKGYNVSIPAYSSVQVNMFMTKNTTVGEMFERLRGLCREAAAETVGLYDKAYKDMFGTSAGNPNYQVQVLTYAELEDICRKVMPDYDLKKEKFLRNISQKTLSGEVTLQDGGIAVLEKTLEWSRITEPVILIGLLPPYVPAVNNHYIKGYAREKVASAVGKTLSEKYGIEVEEDAYFMGLSDNSYISCSDIGNDVIAMGNMVTSKDVYNINYDEIEQIAMPSIIIGPWGKDYHTLTERVYMPDVEKVTPDLLKSIIDNI